MSEIAVRNQPLAQIRAALSEESLVQLEAALPEDVSPSRFMQVANTAVLRDPNLAKPALRQSLFLAAMKCATAGLLPDGEQAALAAFGGDVTFMPMIAGYRYIAGLHGWDLRGYVVYENDDFDYELGDRPRVMHKPPKLGQDRGKEIGAYATATHRDGTVKVEVMDMEAINSIAARASNKTLWKPGSHTRNRMIEKTPAKALFKRLPLGEKETERIRRLLAETDISDPAAALYGPRPELAAVPPGGAATDTDANADGGDGGPQAALSSSPEDGAAPGSFDYSSLAGDGSGTPAPEPGGDDHRTSPAPAETVAPDTLKAFAGKTIAEIADSDAGRRVLLAVLLSPARDEFRTAVEAYAQTSAPEIWKSYVEAKFGSES